MKIEELREYFQESLCLFDLQARDKKGALAEMVDLISSEYHLKDREIILEMLLNRESLGSTAIGKGVAFPHGRTLAVPERARSMVLFAHGSGSSRLSPRNVYVAEVLRTRGIGTLLFDLLTEEEDRDHEQRFDIPLLTGRLVATTHWLQRQFEDGEPSVGYFGASTGAASA